MKQIPFDEDEAILLLDAYLRVTKDGQNRRRALADLSDVLRKRALAKGLAITDSFRTVNGLSGQFFDMGVSYSGGPQDRKNSLFDKTVELYKNNYPKYERRLDEIQDSLSMSTNIPPMLVNTTPQLMEVLESHKDGFRRWFCARNYGARFFSYYWNALVKILVKAVDYGFINGSFDGETLVRVQTRLFALPDFQAKVFPSRGLCFSALRKFIDYWNEKTEEDEKNTIINRNERSDLIALGKFIDDWNDNSREDKEDEENMFDEGGKMIKETPDELLYEFGEKTSLAWTRPVRAAFDSGETFEENSWTRLYAWVVQSLHSRFPRQMQNLLQEAKEKGNSSDFLDAEGYEKHYETYRYSIKRIDDNFYLNTNHNATAIGEKIQKWLEVCGLGANALKIYYVKTKEQISKKAPIVNIVKPVSSTLSYKELVRVNATVDAIREHFPNGFKFDKSTLALLEQEMGGEIQSAVIDKLQERMFGRKDGLYFLSETIIDPTREEELFEQVDAYLEENGSFELQPLYYAYADDLNRSCIRDVGDFEDWLRYFAPQDLRFTSMAKFRIARDFEIFRTEALLIENLLQNIRAAAHGNYGTLQEDVMVEMFSGFSLEFLSYFVKKKADDVFVREINETICFQTVEGLGVPEDFSEKLLETLEQIDDLGFTPSTEVIHVLLSSNCGRNIRNEFGLEDDRSFRTLIESHYEGKEPRKWKSGVFEKEEI